jgi:hypothetical protein
MKYSESYLETHDIDWFCLVNGIPVHFASAGGLLPDWANDREKLRSVQRHVNLLPNVIELEDIRVNESLGEHLNLTDEQLKDYLQSFISMAQKGFISYDKADISNPGNMNYRFVCGPKERIHNVPLMQVIDAVYRTKMVGFDYENTVLQLDVKADLM